MYKLLLLFLCFLSVVCYGQSLDYKQTLSLLELDKPGLEKVQSAYREGDYNRSADLLLEYYRNREPIKGRVNKFEKADALGKGISETDQIRADDGLKHKFVGQQLYPPFFVGEDIDWKTNPVDDREWILQLHRMYWWNSMARAYWDSGDEKYAKAWVFQLQDWIKKNPYVEGDNIAWRPLEVGSRLLSWTNLFEYFVRSPNFTPDVLITFLNSFYEQAEYVTQNYSAIGNHSLHQGEGVLYSGVCFYEFTNASKWRRSAINLFKEQINQQVLPDGMQFELSTHYHMGAVNSFLNVMIIAGDNGYQDEFDQSYVDKVEKMIKAVYIFSLPDFTVTQFGNSWKHTPERFAGSFKKWKQYYPRSDFEYFATPGNEGTPPAKTSLALKDAGIYSMRSKWGEDGACMVLKCGPQAFFHSHPDNGGFELYAKGRHFMPDSGSYIYNREDPWHQWFRRTASHQTLTLDYENTESKPNLLIWQTEEDFDCLVVENQSYDNLKHRRAVLFNKEFFVIVDDAIGQAEGDVRIHFQFKPSDAIFDGLSARTNFADGANLKVKTMPQEGIELQKEEGWVSYIYTQKHKRPAFSFKKTKQPSDNVRFVTVILPYIGNEPNIDIQVGDDSDLAQTKLKVNINDTFHHFGFDLIDKKAYYNK